MNKNISNINNFEGHKKFWDMAATTIGDMTPFDTEIFQKFVTNKDAVILDYGCGYGRTINQICRLGYSNLVGVDISEKMIMRGKKDHPQLNLFFSTDRLNEIYEPNSFDALILLGVLTCIADDELQIDLINQVMAVLKIGGIIYINDFLLNTDARNIERYNKLRHKSNKYPYGVFELEEGVLFRHQDLGWVEKLLSSFTKLYYMERKYDTLNRNTGNGFVYVGKKM